MKCELHVASQDEQQGGQIPKGGKNKGGEWKRKTASRQGHDPDFSSEAMEFHGVSGIVPELSFVRYVERFFSNCLPHMLLGCVGDIATLHGALSSAAQGLRFRLTLNYRSICGPCESVTLPVVVVEPVKADCSPLRSVLPTPPTCGTCDVWPLHSYRACAARLHARDVNAAIV